MESKRVEGTNIIIIIIIIKFILYSTTELNKLAFIYNSKYRVPTLPNRFQIKVKYRNPNHIKLPTATPSKNSALATHCLF